MSSAYFTLASFGDRLSMSRRAGGTGGDSDRRNSSAAVRGRLAVGGFVRVQRVARGKAVVTLKPAMNSGMGR
jgi:hypothetical protein